MNGAERPVVWLGSCRRDLRSFPREVRREIGPPSMPRNRATPDPAAKPMKGFGGASVLEIVLDYRGDTWRAVYTIRFREAVYVLHVFQKKSKRGIATPKQEIEVIKRRLAEAEHLHRERQN